MNLRSQSDSLPGVATGTLSLLLILLALLVREPSLRKELHTDTSVPADTLSPAALPGDSLESSEEVLVVDSVAAPAPTVADKEIATPRKTRKPPGIFAAQVKVTLRWVEGKKRNRVSGRLPSGLRAKTPLRMEFDLVVTPSGHIRRVAVKEPGADPAQLRLAQNTIRIWRFAPLARNVRQRDQHCLVTWVVQPAR